jgi:Protein of unknown function (DUF2867)
MATTIPTVTSVLIPDDSAIRNVYSSVDLSDAYSIVLPPGTTTDPELLARHVFAHQAFWVNGLLAVRDLAVSGFGLKTSKHLKTLAVDATNRVSVFKIYSKRSREIILGEDDKHLDFRLSVYIADHGETGRDTRLVLSTVVHCHNLFGRAYILAIEQFHRIIVKSSLRQAAIVGWPRACDL